MQNYDEETFKGSHETDKTTFGQWWTGPHTWSETQKEYWMQYYQGTDVVAVAYRAWKTALDNKQEEFSRMENTWRERLAYETRRLRKAVFEAQEKSRKVVEALECLVDQKQGHFFDTDKEFIEHIIKQYRTPKMDETDKTTFEEYICKQAIGDREAEHAITWQAALEYERNKPEIKLGLNTPMFNVASNLHIEARDGNIKIKELEEKLADIEGQRTSAIIVYEEKVDRLIAQNRKLVQALKQIMADTHSILETI